MDSCASAASWPDGKQPVKFMLGKRVREPAEQEVRSTCKWSLAERNPERKFEERGRSVGVAKCVVEKCALDFAAALRDVLRDDEKIRLRVGGKLLFAPECAGD